MNICVESEHAMSNSIHSIDPSPSRKPTAVFYGHDSTCFGLFFLTYQTSDIKDATKLIVKISLISLIRSVLQSLYIPETLTFFIDCSLKNVIGYGV